MCACIWNYEDRLSVCTLQRQAQTSSQMDKKTVSAVCKGGYVSGLFKSFYFVIIFVCILNIKIACVFTSKYLT